MQAVFACFGIFLILMFILLGIQVKKPESISEGTAESFEKTLHGKLHHFKCPSCNGIFAIKKSKQNNKKAFMLTCPDCGFIGQISSSPKTIEDIIPEKKSNKIRFQCKKCYEWISLWAEGTELHPKVTIFSCPYCGEKQMIQAD